MNLDRQQPIEQREASLSKALAEHYKAIKQHFPDQIFTSQMLSQAESKPGANLGGPLKFLCREGLLFSHTLTYKLVGHTTLNVYSLKPINEDSIPLKFLNSIKEQNKQNADTELKENKETLTNDEISALEKLSSTYNKDSEIGYEAIRAILTKFKIKNTGIFFNKAIASGYFGYIADRGTFKNSSFKMLKKFNK